MAVPVSLQQDATIKETSVSIPELESQGISHLQDGRCTVPEHDSFLLPDKAAIVCVEVRGLLPEPTNQPASLDRPGASACCIPSN